MSNHFRKEKKGDWMFSPIWKLDFTCPLIRIDYKSPTQFPRAALKLDSHLPKNFFFI